MTDEQPNNFGMAIGELKGQLTGVVQMLTQQNISSAANREEMMRFLKNTHDNLQTHIKDDAIINNTVGQLVNWQKDTSPKVDELWDKNNGQKGFIAALIGISSLISGGAVAVIEYFKR